MDILGALKKLLGGQPQSQAQPVNQHMPTAAPFPTHPSLRVGVIDKPTVQPQAPLTPSTLQAQLPQNKPTPLFRIYNNPSTGAQTLENDFAEPNDPSAVHPYTLQRAPVDSPHPMSGYKILRLENAVPQYQRPIQQGNRARSL